MIYRVDVRITTPLAPTEVEDRVVGAVRNLFPSAEVVGRDGELVLEAHSLDRVAERLLEQRIVATAREVFRGARRGDAFAFDLKKQAATQGVVNFAVGGPSELGDLHVHVRVDEPDVDELIDYLAPAAAGGDGRG